ncbi:Pentatricopeptide repeat-containing protein At1g50270 [Linum grandiflorum]
MRRNSFHPDEHTFPLLLKLFSKSKDRDPMVLYPDIIKHGLDLDAFVRNSLISALANYGNLNLARQVFDESPHKEVVAWTAMIEGYVRNGDPEEGIRCFLTMRSLFDEMPTRNVISWSGLIAGFVQLNRYNEALLSFQEMLIDNVKPNPKTLTTVLTAIAQLGALEQGKWIHVYIDRNSLMNSFVATSMIDMYMKCGCINEAIFVFDNLPRKGLYTWTAMINGLAMNGESFSSLQLFSKMMISGIQPNKVTFLAVLGACAHGGLVNEGRKLFKMMKDECSLVPDVDHYGCMVDLLGRAGYLDEAMEVIKGMPMEPSSGVWGALLGGCVIHGNFEIGECVAEHLMKLGGGCYALVANVYSAKGKWDDAAGVRKVMKGKRVEKSAGVSWIEVDGEIREFVAFDVSHSCWEELCRVLETFRQSIHVLEL